VVYSATKHIDGQGRCLGGVILGSEKFIQDNVHQLIRQTGKAAAFRFQDALELVRISNNLGDAKSLITHPAATTTHQRLTAAERAELGISDGLVRLSCGLEHPDDIVADVMTALKAA
jgi:cystathionine beta-lyase/cystathionine gamma-synthase